MVCKLFGSLKIISQVICLLAGLWGISAWADSTGTANADAQAQPNPSRDMIRHTVVFRLKHDPGSAAEKEFLEAIQVLEEIPEVRAFERLRQVGSKNDFTFGLSMEFADQAAYDRYDAHPVHQRFVNERWVPEVEDFLEIDYIPYP